MSTTKQRQKIEGNKSFENLKSSVSLHVNVDENSNIESDGGHRRLADCSGESSRNSPYSGFESDSLGSRNEEEYALKDKSESSSNLKSKIETREGTSSTQALDKSKVTTVEKDEEIEEETNEESKEITEGEETQLSSFYFANLPKNYFGNNASLWENEHKIGLASSSYTSRALEHLKRKSLHEVWSSQGNGFSQDFPLIMYLDLTFRRVHNLGHILGYWVKNTSKTREENENKPIIILWDTGLISKSMQPLYCIMIPFNKLPRHEVPHQYNAKWCIRYFQVPSKFAGNEKKDQFHRILGKEFFEEYTISDGIKRSILPKPANYFHDVTEVASIIYDTRISVEKSYLSTEYSKTPLSKACLPKKLQSLSWGEIEQKMKVGISETLTLLQRDYRMAIPVGIPFIDIVKYKDILNQKPKEKDFYFYDAFDSGGKLDIQLLIPLCTMKRVYSPDCAVTLKYVPGKTSTSEASQRSRKRSNKPHYEVTHIMSIDQAFILARRHQHIDQLWLIQNPTPQIPQTQSQPPVNVTQTNPFYSPYFPMTSEASTPMIYTPTAGSSISIPMIYTPYFQYGANTLTETSTLSMQSTDVLPSNYKTSLCSSFKLYGYCPYGSMCHFAHGVNELRVSPDLSPESSGDVEFKGKKEKHHNGAEQQ